MVIMAMKKAADPDETAAMVAGLIAQAQAKAQSELEIDLDKHFSHLHATSTDDAAEEAAKQRAQVAMENLKRSEEQDEREMRARRRLLEMRQERGVRLIQREWRAQGGDPERAAGRAAYRARRAVEREAERLVELKELERQTAAAVRIQAAARGKSVRIIMDYNARLTCDLQQKIPVGASADKSRGAMAKRALYLQGRAREVPLPAQLAAIHRGYRYMDAGSSFNKGRSDTEALWLLSEAADDLCQIAADRPATRERLKNLTSTPQHHRQAFLAEAPDPMVFGPPRPPTAPAGSSRGGRGGARTPKLERAIAAISAADAEKEARQAEMSLPASPVDSITSMNSVSSMSGVYGVTPRKAAKRTGCSLSARSTVACPSTVDDTGAAAFLRGTVQKPPEPEPEPEPEQIMQPPIPVHWGRTQNAVLPKLAPPERFNLLRAQDIETLAAHRATLAGQQQQMKRRLKLECEQNLTQIKQTKERQHDHLAESLWSQDNGRDTMRAEKEQLEAQLSSGRATLETLLGTEGVRTERVSSMRDLQEKESARRDLIASQAAKEESAVRLAAERRKWSAPFVDVSASATRDRSMLVKYFKAGPPTHGRLPATRSQSQSQQPVSAREQRIAKDRFARTALAHELVGDINTEKHDAARRAHVKNMHQQRLRMNPKVTVPREYMEHDPTRGLSAATVHCFTQEHLAFAVAASTETSAAINATEMMEAAAAGAGAGGGGGGDVSMVSKVPLSHRWRQGTYV